MDAISRLATFRQAAKAYPFPDLSEAACARRFSFLVRTGVIPLGVAVHVQKRCYLDLGKLGDWLAAGGSRSPGGQRQPSGDEPQRAAEA